MTSASVPDQVAGCKVGRPVALGVFGETYLGWRGRDPVVLKVLREGEVLRVSELDYRNLQEHAELLHFATQGPLSDGRWVLSAARAAEGLGASLGCVVGGSSFTNACNQAARDLDSEMRCANGLRRTSLVERVRLLQGLAESLQGLHDAGWRVPVITPWNVLYDGERLILTEVGLGHQGDPQLLGEVVHEDVLVYLAPEVRDGMFGRHGYRLGDESTGADVYALAATARSFLLNQLAEPDVQDDALDRREQVNAMAGLARTPHQRFSPRLERLLGRCLSAEAQQRPTAGELAAALGELLDEERVAWEPPSAQLPFLLGSLLVVLVLVVLSVQRAPDASPRRAAIERFVAASRIKDLPARAKALEAITFREGGVEAELPGVRRMLAIDDYSSWKAAASEGQAKRGLAAVLDRLERDAMAGYEDDLSRGVRFVAGFLRRWELGGADEARGTALLEALSDDPNASAGLRNLARAARAFTALDAEDGKVPDAWLAAAKEAAGGGGVLSRPAPVMTYRDRSPADQPGAVSLDAVWIAQAVLGRLHSARGEHGQALAALGEAHWGMKIFATRAALGLELAAHGEAKGVEVAKLLDLARASRDCAELHLAQGHSALRAHDFKGARRAFEAAVVADPYRASSRGRIVIAARRGLLATGFQEALAGPPQEAEPKLRAMRKAYRDDAVYQKRYETDVTLALALALVGLDRRQEGAELLWGLYRRKRLEGDWSDLPRLDPQPKTRAARQKVLAILLADLSRAAEALASSARPEKAQVVQLETRSRYLRAELASEAGRLAQAWLRLVRAHVAKSDDPAANVAPHTKGLGKVLDGLIERAAPSVAASALRARIRLVHVRLAGRDEGGRITVLSAGLRGLDERLLKLGDGAGPKFAAERRALTQALLGALRIYTNRRQARWDAIRPEGPKYDAKRGRAERRLLRVALAPFAKVAPAGAGVRERMATALHYLALLEWTRSDAAAFTRGVDHAERALKLLGAPGEEDESGELRKRIEFALGLAVLREGKDRKRARDALARSLGQSDYPSLRKQLDNEDFAPFGPVGREQAPSYWVARSLFLDGEALAKAKQTKAARRAFAEAVEAYQAFGRLLGDRDPPPGTAGWKKELAAATKRAKGEQ